MAGQVVNITIDVTDDNASEAVQQVVAQLSAIGPAGEAAGAAAGAGLDQVGEHALSSRENVRLLSEEMGIHVPRAMQSVIAQSELMMGAISMIGPAMIAIGGADILMMMGEKVLKAYDKWVLMKDEIAETEAVVKSFGDASAAALEKQNSAMEQFLRITQGAKAADIYHLENFQNTTIDISKQFQSDDFKKLSDKAKGDFEKITGDSLKPQDFDKVIEKLEDYNAVQRQLLSTLNANRSSGQYSEFQSMQMARQIEDEERRVRLGESLLGDVSQQKQTYNISVMGQQAQIDNTKPGTSEQQEQVKKHQETLRAIADLDEKALEFGLVGIARLEQQREYADSKWVGSGQDAVNMRAAIDRDYYAQEATEREKQAAEEKKKSDAIANAQRQFNQEMQQIGAQSDNAQTTGYARIEEEANKSLVKIGEDYEKLSRTAGVTMDQLIEAGAIAAGVMAQVEANKDREIAQLHTKTMEQISKEEEQTARLGQAQWKQAALAIQDAWEDKTRAIIDDENQQLAQVKADSDAARMIQDEANQKRLAADQLMHAQLQKAEEEDRDKLAQGLQSMFSDPAKFFEKRAMDTAFQLMANEMLSTFKSSGPAGGILQYLFGMGPDMNTSTNPLNAIGSVLGLSGSSTTSSPGMIQFQQGSTTLLTASQGLISAATSLQSAAGTLSMGGGSGGIGGSSFGGGGSSMFAGGAAGDGSTSLGDGSSPSFSGSTMPLDLGSSGSYTTAAGNGVINASSLGSAGSGFSDSNPAGAPVNGMGAAMGIAGGALMGATSIFSAYQNSNPLAGAIGGAMGGAETGAAIGSIVPGIGTAVGAVVGGIAGAIGGLFAGIFGDKGRGQAESLDVNTIQPTLAKDLQDYEAGRAGYNTLNGELNSLLISSKNSTASMGSGARNYYGSNIEPEINAVITSLQRQEIGGRSAVTMSAAQFHSGGFINDFGDLGTSDSEGFIHAQIGETVMNPAATAAHAPILAAMNSGTNFGYSNSVQPRMPSSSSGGQVTLNISALDSKSVAAWARAGGGRTLVAAINQAQRQYAGVGRG